MNTDTPTMNTISMRTVRPCPWLSLTVILINMMKCFISILIIRTYITVMNISAEE
jgi:hypothetical protein